MAEIKLACVPYAKSILFFLHNILRLGRINFFILILVLLIFLKGREIQRRGNQRFFNVLLLSQYLGLGQAEAREPRPQLNPGLLYLLTGSWKQEEGWDSNSGTSSGRFRHHQGHLNCCVKCCPQTCYSFFSVVLHLMIRKQKTQ